MNLVLQMQSATPSGERHICRSCVNLFRRQGAYSGADLEVCDVVARHSGGRAGAVKGPVAICSHYHPAHEPQLWALQEIAWEITSPGERGRVGFISPADRRAAGIPQAAPPPATR